MKTACVLIISLLLAAPGSAELFHRGDTNLDAQLDISDAVFILVALFVDGAAAPGCADGADANDDGRIDITDAISLLEFLFDDAPPLPQPFGSCLGPDPTPDELDCADGEPASARAPELELVAVRANAPGIRQRSRKRLSIAPGGGYRVASGVAFGLLLVARSNLDSRTGFTFDDPDSIIVTCDRDLGDAANGGVRAGTNLAPYFLDELDTWENRIYLLEHAAMRIAGDGPLGPRAGTYRFTARVRDDACAWSSGVEMTLVVEPVTPPEIHVWLERDGDLLQHDPGTGNARVLQSELADLSLVVEAVENGQDGGALDPESLRVTFDSPLISDPPVLLSDLPKGDTDVIVSVDALDGSASRSVVFRIEVAVSHALDIRPIWNSNCTGCHELPDPFKGLVLVDSSADEVYRNIVNVYAAEPEIISTAPLLIWPYHPERSYLLHKVRGTFLDPDVAGEGVRMPADGSELPADALHLLQSWIAQGAEK